MAKKKQLIEADLDPVGTRRTRPGGYAAKVAVANARALMKRRTTKKTSARGKGARTR